MKVRMKDIAKLANVSEATVSLVLNDKPSRISESKKVEIKKIAAELNYIPNIAAQSLAKRKTNTIGIVIPDIENPFFAKLSKEIEKQLREIGYLTILTNSNDGFENEKALISTLLNRGVDGLILALSNQAFHDTNELQQFLLNIPIPFVLVDRPLHNKTISQVYFDSFNGAYLLTKELLERGHQRIVCMIGDNHVPNAQSKIAGMQKAFAEYNVSFAKHDIVEIGYTFEDGYHKSDAYLLNKEMTAISATNDMVALGIMKRAKELAINIPNDKSLIGYDKLAIIEMVDIELSSVNQDTKKLAINTTCLLEKLLQNNHPEQIILNPELVLKKSIRTIGKTEV
ncbi:LacI family DNA-binding transcriptional regulator [Enterococcus saccharolyticus]|uniref:LacI family DNA-binding transcriptional regulator n=1 Tax=Enterococcus saccharolyticus TaxID=41997 RepID=UPI001E51DBF2|nr:LacI family DNA-binding transcriptional regulator [Enterococcus saccharolyticus]MCD5001876.1 LacI family DNA-binding transcriptional regulator [Enterococcus saccharolyticus]